MSEYALPKLSEVQRERLEVLDIFEGPDNLVVADYAKLAGKSRRWIAYEIQARNLFSIRLGNKGQRVKGVLSTRPVGPLKVVSRHSGRIAEV
ncbi:hypothetical protein [Xanthomonas cissicola]|uniref:hypothetical protein n=1 Tax=Xanthomonas cissicola TaxID=86186 RepID=UPI003CCDE047